MAMATGTETSRPDGRFPNQLRSLACSRGLLHRAHGSARWSQGIINVILFLNRKKNVQLMVRVLRILLNPLL